MTSPLIRVVETCAACPSQWDAWTVDGQYLYLRYRFGVGTVDAYDSPDSCVWTRPPYGSVAAFGEQSWDGVIGLEDFCAAAGLVLAPGVEVIS